MTRKLGLCALLVAAVGMFTGTGEAEARHCRYRRHRCCYQANYGCGGAAAYNQAGYYPAAGCGCR